MSRPSTPIEILETRIVPAGLPTLDVQSLAGVTGLEITGTEFIFTVQSIGDFNGDTINDFAITSPLGGAAETGNVYVIFGKETGFPALLNLANLNGTDGFKVTGELAGDQLGTANTGGDINGDGKSDLILSAILADNGGNNRGTVYVIFGAATSNATLAVSSLNGTTGFKIVGDQDLAQFGRFIDAGGDFNNDGIGDLIVGTPYYDVGGKAQIGLVTVVFGHTGAFNASMGQADVNGANGFSISGITNGSRFGSYVNHLDDVNGDGIDELSLGTSETDSGSIFIDNDEGETGYVLFGHQNPWPASSVLHDVIGVDGWGFYLSDARGFDLGSTAQSLDVNGDGLNDLVVLGGGLKKGALTAPAIGAFLSNGNPILSDPADNKKTKLGAVVFIPDNNEGSTLVDRGDFNGDGFLDFAVSKTGEETAQLYFGTKLSGTRFVGKSTTDQGFLIAGVSSNFAGGVRFIGDINGDGFDDVAVQAPNANGPGERAFIIFGSGLKIARGGKSATWMDTDGDVVTLKVTKGALDFTQFQFAPKQAGDKGIHLNELDLSGHGGIFDGTNVTVTVKKNPIKGQGDGLVNLGRLNATGVDLGIVKIAGSLGEVDAGDPDLTDGALKSFTASAFGQIAGGPMPGPSDIKGPVGSFTVNGAMKIASLNLTGGALASLSKLSVKGDFFGAVSIAGTLGSFKVRDFAAGSSLTASTAGKGAALTARLLGDGTILNIAGKIASLQAGAVGTATIIADTLAKLTVTGEKATSLNGDFHASLTLTNSTPLPKVPALGTVKIAGLVKDASIYAAGNIGAVTVGAIEGSRLYAGYLPNLSLVPLGGGTFSTTATLKSLLVTGAAASRTASTTAFANSFVIAAIVGKVTLPSVDDTNAGTLFGIGFRDTIAGVKIKTPLFAYNLTTAGTQSLGDFRVADL